MLRLFLELADIAVVPGVHDAEPGSLLQADLDDRDGAGGVPLLMLAQHFGVVHFIDMVARKDQHVFRIPHIDKIDVLVDGVGRAGEPVSLLPG